MSNDCSERICQFGLAHVDTPKGDLDSSSGKLYSPNPLSGAKTLDTAHKVATPIVVGSDLYPKGTYEQFASVIDSEYKIIDNSAHDYMECSNKGICDRSTGVCGCFAGYDGSACQRASCPSSTNGQCSGHGMCQTISKLAKTDYNNSYLLWDEYSTMGCVCDPGFEGPDCSKASCKYGSDPLYYDDVGVNIRYSNFTFAIYNVDKQANALDKADGAGGSARSAAWKGNFSIVFFDHFGKAWQSDAIDIHANCDEITNTLEALPNRVIPSGSVRCSKDFPVIGTYLGDSKNKANKNDYKRVAGIAYGFPFPLPKAFYNGTDPVFASNGYGPFVANKFTLAFPQNPGKLRQPYINIYLDGTRRTVSSMSTAPPATTVGTWVYPNGYSGEDTDFVPDLCQGVLVTIKGDTHRKSWGVLDGLTAAEIILLKKCLGDADGIPTNNNKNKDTTTQDALYNWDYGITQDIIQGTTAKLEYHQDKLLNPHLIKLVDTTINQETRLCDVTDHFFTGVDQINNTIGYCINPDAPGFYVVLYFDPSDNGGTFKFLSRAHQDFTLVKPTTFNVFTTTGFLKLASMTTEVYTTPYQDLAVTDAGSVVAELNTYYTNVVYTYANSSGGANNVDCETQSNNPTKVLQCIEKGDYVMIFDTKDEPSSGNYVSSNPKYHNIYQVMKISRENRETTLSGEEYTRYQIILDMSMNARYAKSSTVKSNARIYKFTPPQTRVDYVGQCSNRGICDSASGVCKCFSGYTGDDCSAMNALATK